MTELGCPGEERVNFGTQRDVLDDRETITVESRSTSVCLTVLCEVDSLYSRMTGSNLLLQLWFQPLTAIELHEWSI